MFKRAMIKIVLQIIYLQSDKRLIVQGFKIIILCENGEGLECLEDIIFWENPRLKIYDWVVVNGHPVKKQKYPKATKGTSLYKSLKTIRDKYGVEFRFCDKGETGFKILELLERK